MRRLYESTREEEMKQFPFDEFQKREFLDQQFGAQYQHYQLHNLSSRTKGALASALFV